MHPSPDMNALRDLVDDRQGFEGYRPLSYYVEWHNSLYYNMPLHTSKDMDDGSVQDMEVDPKE